MSAQDGILHDDVENYTFKVIATSLRDDIVITDTCNFNFAIQCFHYDANEN